MPLIRTAPDLLSPESLARLRDRVSAATEPERMGPLGPNPYHVTFWYGLGQAPRNVVEEVVSDRLRAQLPEPVRARAAGVEWWLGRLQAPYAENFEFGAHRDFGENSETGALESPLLSSIFYLTTLDDGPLVVFRAEPVGEADASRAEHLFPRENTFAMFPGHLWHAVLSRRLVLGDTPSPPASALRLTLTVNWWAYRPSGEASAPMKLVAGDYDGSIYPELRCTLAELTPQAAA